jgi:hypothetical protein
VHNANKVYVVTIGSGRLCSIYRSPCTRTQKHYCESYQLRSVVMRRLGLPRLAKFDTYPVLRNGLGKVYTIPKHGLANHVLSFGKRLAYNMIPLSG